MELPMSLEPLVTLYRSMALETPHVELEARLGYVDDADGHFRPGVDKEVFEQLLADLNDTSSLQSDHKWFEIVDYNYVTSEGTAMRTRVEFDTENMVVSTHHCTKESLSKAIVRHSEEESSEACRLALSVEHPVHTPPETCVPTHVRVQQRRRFRDVRDGDVVWSYELSKTWSATSRHAVEEKQHLCEPIYEVECELVDRERRYLSASDDAHVTKSLMMKMALLLGHERAEEMVVQNVTTFDPVKKTSSRSVRSRGRGRRKTTTKTTTT